MTNVTQLNPFYRGDDFALEIKVRDKETQSPIDITGWVLVSSLKLSTETPDDPEMHPDGYRQVLRVLKVVTAGAEAEAGTASLLFPHDQTAELLPTRYQIDIQAEHDDTVITLLKSTIEVQADVTRDTYDCIPVFAMPAVNP